MPALVSSAKITAPSGTTPLTDKSKPPEMMASAWQSVAGIWNAGALAPAPLGIRRSGRRSGVEAPACGCGHGLRRPPRSPGARLWVSAARRRSPVSISRRPRHLQGRCLAAQGGMVRHAQGQPEPVDDGADQALGLAPGEAEHRAQGQRRQDRQRRVAGLTTSRGARRSPPTRDRLRREPDGDAVALTQAGVVVAPVGDLARLLADRVAAVVVQLERQRERPGSDHRAPPASDRLQAPPDGIRPTTRHARTRRPGRCQGQRQVRTALRGVAPGQPTPPGLVRRGHPTSPHSSRPAWIGFRAVHTDPNELIRNGRSTDLTISEFPQTDRPGAAGLKRHA